MGVAYCYGFKVQSVCICAGVYNLQPKPNQSIDQLGSGIKKEPQNTEVMY